MYTVEALAEFFGICSEYFTEPDGAYRQWLDTELGWLDLARNRGVRRLTTVLIELDADTREKVMAAAGI